MTRPFTEMTLNHPVEIDRVIYDKLAITHLGSLASFRANSPEQILRSMALVFGVPRRVVRRLAHSDIERAGDLLVEFLDAAAHTSQPPEI
jgi:hypothetical protein